MQYDTRADVVRLYSELAAKSEILNVFTSPILPPKANLEKKEEKSERKEETRNVLDSKLIDANSCGN